MIPLKVPRPPPGDHERPGSPDLSMSMSKGEMSTLASSFLPPPVAPRATHRISLSAIRSNYRVIENRAADQKCNVMAVVKADAYGHGAWETASFLWRECGCDSFCVVSSFLPFGVASGWFFYVLPLQPCLPLNPLSPPPNANPPSHLSSVGYPR